MQRVIFARNFVHKPADFVLGAPSSKARENSACQASIYFQEYIEMLHAPGVRIRSGAI
jgi:hypothetical protein